MSYVNTIGQSLSNQDEMKSRMSPSGGEGTYVLFPSESVTPETTVKIVTADIANSTDLFWDHPTQGEWDNFNWAGANPYDDEVVHAVRSQNNLFREMFLVDTFIDTSLSSGTITTSGTGSYFVDGGQELVTELVAKNNKAYTRVIVNATGTDTNNAIVTLSLDGGSIYNSITLGVENIIANTSVDGIKIKFRAPSGITFGTTGLSFPISLGGSGSPFTLTEYTLQYN